MVEGTLGWTSQLMGQQLSTRTPFLPMVAMLHARSLPGPPGHPACPHGAALPCARLPQLPQLCQAHPAAPCIRFTQLPPVPGAPLERSQTF